jgi:hypothetical protein
MININPAPDRRFPDSRDPTWTGPGRVILPCMPTRPHPPRSPRHRSPHAGPPTAPPGLAVLLAVVGLTLALAGCSAPAAGPGSSLRLPPDRYAEAFGAAADVLSDHGLAPAVRDRRAGVIETDPENSAGWFAPWNIEPASDLESVATLSTVRRRARITFTAETAVTGDAEDELQGPDLFGLREPPADLGQARTPVAMRVAVYVERSHRPGQQVDTWSRRLRTQARVGRPSPASGFEPGLTWWPVSRDEGLERAILEQVAARLRTAPDPAPDPTPATD